MSVSTTNHFLLEITVFPRLGVTDSLHLTVHAEVVHIATTIAAKWYARQSNLDSGVPAGLFPTNTLRLFWPLKHRLATMHARQTNDDT
jgi:hypothetical protein